MAVFKRRLQDGQKGPATFIAATTKIEGRILGDGPFIFSGRVEGDCEITGLVTLTETAHWVGTLTAADLVLAGTIEGNVLCSGRVEIASTAKITGTLTGLSVAVAQGAVIDGEIKVLGGGTTLAFEEKRQP